MPACDAVIVTVPAFNIVTETPDMLAMVGSLEANVTVSPELAVAERSKGGSWYVFADKTPNVIDWEPLVITRG